MKKYTIKAEELAKRFNVTHKTILNWFENKNLPGIRMGGIIRFNNEDIEEWIREQNNCRHEKRA